MNAQDLPRQYLSSIQNVAAAATLLADDGIVELPTTAARIEGRAAIQGFLNGLLMRVPDIRFENIRIWIDTPDRVFAEYEARGQVTSTGQPHRHAYPGASHRGPRTDYAPA